MCVQIRILRKRFGIGQPWLLEHLRETANQNICATAGASPSIGHTKLKFKAEESLG